jgi:hypothetical protein
VSATIIVTISAGLLLMNKTPATVQPDQATADKSKHFVAAEAKQKADGDPALPVPQRAVPPA